MSVTGFVDDIRLFHDSEGDAWPVAVSWAIRGQLSAWWDGHPFRMYLWDVRHPPKEMFWRPTRYWHLKRWNPVFWIVLVLAR